MTRADTKCRHDARAATVCGGPLTAADLARLLGMLGLLGSDHAGERAAAGLHAARLLRDRGLTWADIVVLPPAPAPEPPTVGDTDWRRQATEAARYPGLLHEGERGFLRAIVEFPRLSPKQAEHLQRIVAKVRGGG